MRPGVRLVVCATLLCQAHGYAQVGPQPPCGKESAPPYRGLNDPAIVKPWSTSDFDGDWKPPACTGWTAPGFTTLVSTAGRFRHTSGAEGLLLQIGAISKLAGMQYWSTSHKRWQTLVVAANALTGLQSGQRRADFTVAEVKEGNALYFEQTDNLAGKAIYRMRLLQASADRLVFEVENVSAMRRMLLTLFSPGEMQAIYFLDRESENMWRFYSILRTGKNASRLTARNQASAVNRAAAYYRHYVGIPTAQEPPAAR